MGDPKRRNDAKNNQADRVIAIERSLWRPLVSRHWEFGASPSGNVVVMCWDEPPAALHDAYLSHSDKSAGTPSSLGSIPSGAIGPRSKSMSVSSAVWYVPPSCNPQNS